MSDSILPVLPSFRSTLAELYETPVPHDDSARRLLFADGISPPLSLETYVRGYWNRSSLFILFSGRYLNLRMDTEDLPLEAQGRTPRLWDKSDVFELMIGRDCARTGRYKEFQVAPNGRWMAADVSLAGDQLSTNEGWTCNFRSISFIHGEENVWRAGMEVPWEDLGGLEAGGEWRCNFYRATGKFHGDELLAWRPTGYGDHCFHRPHLFGTIKIVESGSGL